MTKEEKEELVATKAMISKSLERDAEADITYAQTTASAILNGMSAAERFRVNEACETIKDAIRNKRYRKSQELEAATSDRAALAITWRMP